MCNLGATQFAVGDSQGGRVEVKYFNDDGRPQSLKTITKGENIVAYFIEYSLIFADSSTDPAVYAIDVYCVPALGTSTKLYWVGDVVFCKSRCCNKTFFIG